jgi:ribosomal protein S18 acetylase RimI-like enzyme
MIEVHRYRRSLSDLGDGPPWPADLPILAFDPARHARAVHGLLEEGYRHGGGSVPGHEAWWQALSTDAEYDPDLILLAADGHGTPVAVAICWTSGFVKDLVVDARARRRGLGSALLNRAFRTFADRGARAVDLKVHADNHAAIALYRSAGTAHVETLQVED